MNGPERRALFSVFDDTGTSDGYHYTVSEVLTWRRTRYQDLAIVDTPFFGRALILDGNWQSCTADEFLYHEPLVHPAMLLHGAAHRVAVLGGGEGATIREILRWNAVERVVMVDLDGDVVDACRQYLPEMHCGSFDDPKVELVVGDALDWLDACDEQFDVVISDLSEPLEHGPSYRLFTEEYFRQVRGILDRSGFFALQAGSVAPSEIQLFARVAHTVGSAFDHAKPYASAIPSFGSPWGFVVAADRPLDPLPHPGEVDHLLQHSTSGGLRMLDGEAFVGLFLCSAHIREAVARETTVYTLEHPPKI
ncbi:MAG: methyltransferase domain-containing protein [Gemmatimonadales bacterium]